MRDKQNRLDGLVSLLLESESAAAGQERLSICQSKHLGLSDITNNNMDGYAWLY